MAASSSAGGIVRLDAVPSCADFHRDYLEASVPCILPPALVADWPAHRWASASAAPSDSSQLHPAFHFLASEYATQSVPVVITRSSEGDEERKETSLAEAVSLLQQGKAEYIKDWHLFQQIQQARGADAELPYSVPDLFRDDWMNNVEAGQADFRFLYAGRKGSGTGLHRDVCEYMRKIQAWHNI